MRKPNRYEIGAGLVIAAAIATALFLRFWRIADQAGVSLFSIGALRAAWPFFALLIVALAIAFFANGRK